MNLSHVNQEQRSNARVVLRTGQGSRIKSRTNYKKNVFNHVVTLFNQPIYVHTATMYENPHESKQRYEILQIQSKQAQKNEQKQAFSCDVDFLRRCRNLEYDVLANIKPLLNLQNAGQLFKNEIIEQKYNQMEIGKNIIKLGPSTKYRSISCPMKDTDENKLQGIMIRGDFQSGNLAAFYQINQCQYAIQVKNDTNTRGYTQWFQFYLKIAQEMPDQQFINFIIFNIRKPIRFMPNMKLLTRSYKSERKNYEEWARNLDFQFFQNNLGTQNKKYYSIAFSISAKKLKDGLFVTLTHPYPFSRLLLLCQQINNLQSELKIIEIGKTTLGNPILLYKVDRDTNTKTKKNIFIIARQHASETSSSFICEFIIKRLTIFNCFHKIFTQYNWHIVPMVNADGVIHGNSRTSIRGYDINRCWALHLLNNSVQAQVINNYIQKINVDSDDIFLDIHSHNRQFGMFSYYNFQNQFVRLFNTKMNEVCKYYDILKCRAGYDLSKRTTFRVQMSQQHKIKNIITLETSFYGYVDKNTHELVHFTSHDYEQMAISILKCIQFYTQKEWGNNAKKVNQNSTQKLKIQAEKCHLLCQHQQIQSQSQSDPDPEGDYLNQQDRKDLQHNSMTIICYPRNRKHDQLQKRTYSAQTNFANKNIRNNSSQVKNIHEQHVVNLYQATALNEFPQQSICIEKKFKTLSLGKNKLSNSIVMSMKNQQGFKMMNKTGRNNKSFRQISYSSKQIHNQSYIERISFKNLFKSAQIRNQKLEITQKAKTEHKAQETTGENKIFMKKTPYKQPFRITLSESEKRTTQNIKNIVFPSKIVEKDEYQKSMKVIQQSLRKKNIQINPKCLVIDKKSQVKQKLNDKQVSNKKIALLCEYARNINNQTPHS